MGSNQLAAFQQQIVRPHARTSVEGFDGIDCWAEFVDQWRCLLDLTLQSCFVNRLAAPYGLCCAVLKI